MTKHGNYAQVMHRRSNATQLHLEGKMVIFGNCKR